MDQVVDGVLLPRFDLSLIDWETNRYICTLFETNRNNLISDKSYVLIPN